MRTAVTHITILALLTHAVVGCCWHHEHEGTCETTVNGPCVVDVHIGTHGHDHSDAACERAEDCEAHAGYAVLLSHDHTAACSDAQCVFLKSQPRSWSAAPVAPTLDAALPPNAAPAAALSITPTRTHGRLPRDSAVSLCAQLQVWLI